MTNSEGSATTAAQLSLAPTSAGSLPVEVLRLIFELAVEDDASDEMKERRSILRMTSLVCKAWRTAGQPLLAKGIRIDRQHLNDHDKLIGLFNAIERDQITSLDRMVVRLTGLPHAIRVCEKVGIVRKVDLIGIWFENGLDYLRRERNSLGHTLDCWMTERHVIAPSQQSTRAGTLHHSTTLSVI